MNNFKNYKNLMKRNNYKLISRKKILISFKLRNRNKKFHKSNQIIIKNLFNQIINYLLNKTTGIRIELNNPLELIKILVSLMNKINKICRNQKKIKLTNNLKLQKIKNPHNNHLYYLKTIPIHLTNQTLKPEPYNQTKNAKEPNSHKKKNIPT